MSLSSGAEQLADNYAQGEIDDVPKCGQGKRTKAEQHHKFGWFGPPPFPVATSTPLMNPSYECSTSSMIDVHKEARGDFYAGNEKSLTEEMWDTTAVGNTNMDLSNFCSWASNSMEDHSNDRNCQNPTSSGAISIVDSQGPILMPMQKMITPKTQFVTPNPMLYPHSFGHLNHFPYPPYSTGHLPMPIYQQNEVQTVIIKDIKQEHSENAKNGGYRNCLVCGHNNFACGKYTGTGLQVCTGCRIFFQRIVESGSDKTATFECSSKGSGNCLISKETGTRKSCQFCRFQACLKAGMDRQKVFALNAKHKQENSEDSKDGNGIYRNCLVCGDNNSACGKNSGLQVCNSCRLFFNRMVKSDRDKTTTFECSQGSGNCLISKETRNSCYFCRFQACLKAGMDRQKIVGLKGKRGKAKREQEKQNGSGNEN